MLELILYDLGVFLSFIGIPVGLFLGVGRIFEGIVKKLNPNIPRNSMEALSCREAAFCGQLPPVMV